MKDLKKSFFKSQQMFFFFSFTDAHELKPWEMSFHPHISMNDQKVFIFNDIWQYEHLRWDSWVEFNLSAFNVVVSVNNLRDIH